MTRDKSSGTIGSFIGIPASENTGAQTQTIVFQRIDCFLEILGAYVGHFTIAYNVGIVHLGGGPVLGFINSVLEAEFYVANGAVQQVRNILVV